MNCWRSTTPSALRRPGTIWASSKSGWRTRNSGCWRRYSATCAAVTRPLPRSAVAVWRASSGFLPIGAPLPDRLTGLRPIREEGGEALVRQRMVEHLAQHGRREGRDVGAHLRRLDHVYGMADRGHQHLRREGRIVGVDLHDVADEIHAVGADIVEPADEGRDEGGAGLGRKERLRCGEAQGNVNFRA